MSITHSNRQRRLLLVACLLVGTLLGTCGAGLAGWFWVRSYVESQKFWQDVSQAAGLELTAATTLAQLFPPAVVALGIDGKRDGVKVVTMRRVAVSLSPTALFGLVGAIDVAATGVDWLGRDANGPPAPVSSSNTTGVPKSMASTKPASFELADLPLRRFDLHILATQVTLPVAALPHTDVELSASVTPNSKGGLSLSVALFRALGVQLKAQAELNSKFEGPITITLPGDALGATSIVSGKITGDVGPVLQKIRLTGEMQLPNTTMPIPKNTRWVVAGKAMELQGTARLAGGAAFTLNGSEWNVDASWDLDLAAAKLGYGTYAKPGGKAASVKGHFKGDSANWKLSDVAIALGDANATLSVDAAAGIGMHVIGAVAPFAIAEFVPVLLAQAPRKIAAPKVSGRLSAQIDLALNLANEPSGNVALTLEDWVLDGESVVALAGTPDVEGGGELSVRGRVLANLDKGAFRDGSVRLVFDATDMALRSGEFFEKKSGSPLVMDLNADGSGKAMVVKAVRVQGPGGFKIAAKGSIADLKDYETKLQLYESRVPLRVLGDFLPKLGGASGMVDLSGEFQGSLKTIEGSFAKLQWRMKNVEFEHDGVLVKKLNGELETVMSDTAEQNVGQKSDEGDVDEIEAGRSWLVRATSLGAQWYPTFEGHRLAPITVNVQGSVGYHGRALTGDVTGSVSELDLSPWLAAKNAEVKPVEVPPSAPSGASAAGLDFVKSKFHLSLSAPRITTPYLVFGDAQADLKIGGPLGTPELTLERLAGHALEGDLSLKAKVKLPGAVELAASGQNISLVELAKVVGRVSGKKFDQEMFGSADVEVHGTVDAGVRGHALDTADFKGQANIRNGGFTFMPLPKAFLEQLSHLVPNLGDRLGLSKDDGSLTDRFERAEARFHLKADRLDLDVNAVDSRLGTVTDKGHVTLAGHCELAGAVQLNEKILKGAGAIDPIPFTTVGDGWDCKTRPDTQKLAKIVLQISKAKVVDQVVDQTKEKIRANLKSLGKGLFGN